MAKITLYRAENFNWHGYEITKAVANLNTISIAPEGLQGDLNARVSSMKVESGTWILYEGANFNVDANDRDKFAILGPGDYANFSNLQVRENRLTSLRPLPESGLCLFQHENYSGEMVTFDDDQPNFLSIGYNDTKTSAIVVSNSWHLYQHIDYGGDRWTLGVGRYPTPASGGFRDQTISSVRCATPAGGPPNEMTPQFTLSDALRNKMIPFHKSTYQFTIKVTGSAIKDGGSYPIHFDTGSWTTSIPAANVAPSVTVVTENVKDGWGNECDLVKGQLAVNSVDGTVYAIDDFQFYRIRSTSPKQMAIMGAFPSPTPWSESGPSSFPYLLAKKYAEQNKLGFGFGIVTDTPRNGNGSLPDLKTGWANAKSYLQLGADPSITSWVQWRSDVPKWHNNLAFCPEAVPGFKLKVSIPGTNNQFTSPQAGSDSSITEYMATIDTGAPDLTARLGIEDPQLSAPYSQYFTQNGPSWWQSSGTYRTQARSLEGADVTIMFTDSIRVTKEYTFSAAGAQHSPATLYAGTWNGDVPWPVSTPEKPKNRINLGNTIYYYCPVFFYDIRNKRVGIRFR